MSGELGAYPTAGAVDAELIDEVEALRLIVEGTATGTGREFFEVLVRHMAAVLDTANAFVVEFLGGTRVRTLAYWKQRAMLPEPIEWDLAARRARTS